MDEGGEWKHEVRADLQSERRIRLLPLGVGARSWILGRDSFGGTVAPERSQIGRGFCWLPDGGWIQSGGSLWMGG